MCRAVLHPPLWRWLRRGRATHAALQQVRLPPRRAAHVKLEALPLKVGGGSAWNQVPARRVSASWQLIRHYGSGRGATCGAQLCASSSGFQAKISCASSSACCRVPNRLPGRPHVQRQEQSSLLQHDHLCALRRQLCRCGEPAHAAPDDHSIIFDVGGCATRLDRCIGCCCSRGDLPPRALMAARRRLCCHRLLLLAAGT